MSPFEVKEADDHAVVVFGTYGDALVEDHIATLEHFVKQKSVVVFELTKCRMLDTPWIRLITSLTKESKALGRRVAVAGATDEVKASADYIGHRKHWQVYRTVDDALHDRARQK